MASNFKKSLEVGKMGESLYHYAHKDRLELLDGYKGDFKIIGTDDKLEIKTDSYLMSASPNFCMERYSSVEKKSPGGPWQAKEHGCKYFVYMFFNNMRTFTFEIDPLLERLEKNLSTYREVNIMNRAWITQCVLVPRESIKDLYVQHVIEVSSKKV